MKKKTDSLTNIVCSALAFILLIGTVWGICGYFDANSTVRGAVAETVDAFCSKTDALNLIRNALDEGCTTIDWENSKEKSSGTLTLSSELASDRALCVLSGKKNGTDYSASLSVNPAQLTLHSTSFLDGDLSFARAGLSGAYASSLLPQQSAILSADSDSFLRALSLLADKDQTLDEGAVLSAYADEFIENLRPGAKASNGEITLNDQTIKAKCYTYSFDQEDLSRALNAFWEKGRQDEALISSLISISRKYDAFAGNTDFWSEAQIRAFFADEGGEFSARLAALAQNTALLEVKLYVKGGALVGAQITFTEDSPQYKLEGAGQMFLGTSPADSESAALTFTLSKTDPAISAETGNAGIFALSLRNEISENSKTAYVQEIFLDLSDPASLVIPHREGEDGIWNDKLRIVWGKEKGDIGIKLFRDQDTLSLKGYIDEWKPGKRLDMQITEFSENGTNFFPDTRIRLQIQKKSVSFDTLSGGTELLQADEAGMNEFVRMFSEKFSAIAGVGPSEY